MYIRKTKRVYKGKSYTNHLLVESVQTARGPRQRTICSLGSLEPAPAEAWLGMAQKLEAALQVWVPEILAAGFRKFWRLPQKRRPSELMPDLPWGRQARGAVSASTAHRV